MKRTLFFAVVALLLMTGCSPDTLNVTLRDGRIALNQTTLPEGEVTINVTNSGTIDHMVVILKTDAERLDIDPHTFMVPEEGLVGEIENIPAGKSASLKLDLTAGRYLIICNKPTHYTSGMHISFTVE